MAAFNENLAYKPRGAGKFFDDGRETELLKYLTSPTVARRLQNNPTAILAEIDAYAHTTNFLMNIGPTKGAIVVDAILKHKPRVVVELGGYCGYSTILLADAAKRIYETSLPLTNGTTGSAKGKTPTKPKVFSLERSRDFANNMRDVIELAGLSDIVTVVTGPSTESLAALHGFGALSFEEGAPQHIDLLFLDHWKPQYVTDLRLCEQLGLVSKGTVLCADNVVHPGNPTYLAYVRATPKKKREILEQEEKDGNTGIELFPSRTQNQYKDWDHKNGTSTHFTASNRNNHVDNNGNNGNTNVNNNNSNNSQLKIVGKPSLLYESTLMKSFEPTGEPDGVEISICIGEEETI